MVSSPQAGAARPELPDGRVEQQVRRVAIIGSPDKPAAPEALARLVSWFSKRAEVVSSAITYDTSRVRAARPDLLVVLGGDGTLIAGVHGLKTQQVPVIGVNLGKLGYLADFTPEEIEQEGDFLFSGALPITRRVMIDVKIDRGGVTEDRSPAVNDCVILAGPPFHMIELDVQVDGDEVARIRGDGLIVAAPSGSTAHNLAAGGPILEPTGQAFILTPICPHALSYRPVVLDARRQLTVSVAMANPGTTIATDGRTAAPSAPGDRIVITRYAADFLLVRNPRRSEWHALRRKLRWGEGPNMHV